MADNRLIIFDTTLRDGEQAPGFSMNTPEKLRLARQLQTLGVDVLEAGFPIASSDDAEAVRLIAAEITGPIIAALARCNQADIECAAESVTSAERARIHTFIATSDLHLERKLRISREDCLQAVVDNVTLARGYTDDVEFSAEDATRTGRRFPVSHRGDGDRAGRHDDQPARHRRLLHAGGDRAVLRRHHQPGAQRRQGGLQHALS